jgi:hypothetical protein
MDVGGTVRKELHDESPPPVTIVGFVIPSPPGEEQAEALVTLRKVVGPRRVRVLRLGAEPPALRGAPPLLWWHEDGDAWLSSPLATKEWIRAVRDYVDRGGVLLLSLCAARYVVNLGLESTLPSIVARGAWPEQGWAEGYPDIRGFAARGSHPLFNGMGGGAYTWTAAPGTPYAGTYFHPPALPREGRVLAVEREYIRINPSRPLITEYRTGKGRVLTIGANFYFAGGPQRFSAHLEALLRNAINYLARSPGAGGMAWSYASPPFEEVERKSRPARVHPAPWNPGTPAIGTVHRRAADAPFDLAGRRMLILGDERSGVTEVWAHPLRILSSLAVSFTVKERGVPVSSTSTDDVAIRPESVRRTHRTGDVTVEETIFADPDFPGGAVHFTTDADSPVTIALTARVDLRAMWPLPPSSTGTLRYGWDDALRAWVVTDESGDGVSLLGASAPPVTRRATPHDGQRREVILEASYLLSPGRDLTVVFAGGGNGEADATRAYRTVSANPSARLRAFGAVFRAVRENSTTIESPDREFNAGLRHAMSALERFRAFTPGLGASLMAGFATAAAGWDGGQNVSGRPGYAWYFGRDSVWTSLAFLAAGRTAAAKEVLSFLGAHQDVTGKIFHEMTTSGYAHYDAADATPLYLVLMGRYLEASGDRPFVRSQAEHIERALAFCLSTDTDGDGLIENTNVGHGWIEGGKLFPAHTELYLASCWCEALLETARVARALGKSALARRCDAGARRARGAIASKFWDAETSTYSFALNADGRAWREETVLPAVPMYFRHLEAATCRTSLERFSSAAFSTDWGTRIVGSDSPLYNPAGYHYGSVWPLFTGWTSLAEFAHHRPVQGFCHAMANLGLWPHWSAGGTPEVLHGERMEPAGVCADQAWSAAMVLLPLLEGMLGLRVDAEQRRISLSPYFPPNWAGGEIRNICIGRQHMNVTMRRRMNTTSFDFSTTGRTPVAVDFAPWFPCGTTLHAVRIGAHVSLRPAFITAEGAPPAFSLTVKGHLRVTFEHSGGAAIVPPVAYPSPGQESSGLRLIREAWNDGFYELTLEGKGDQQYAFDVIADGRPAATEDAWIISAGNRRFTLSVRFDTEGPSPRYRRKTVRLSFRN